MDTTMKSSMVSRRVLFVVAALAACSEASGPSTEPPAEPPAQMADAAQIDTKTGTAQDAAAAAAEADAVAPSEAREPAEPTPPPVPAVTYGYDGDAPALHLAYDGRCGDVGAGTVGGEGHVWIGGSIYPVTKTGLGDPIHIGADETMIKLDDRDDPWGVPFSHILAIGGRSADSMFVIAAFADREFSHTRVLVRRENGFRESTVLGRDRDFTMAWPWHSGSTLALSPSEWTPDQPRLAVVRGTPKGPRLDGLVATGGCTTKKDQHADVFAVTVAPDGPVTALTWCNGTWLSVWTPDDRKGRHRNLGGDANDARLALDDEGNGYLLLGKMNLQRLQGGEPSRIKPPKAAPVRALSLDPQGHPWIAIGGTVYRGVPRAEDVSWEAESLPGDAAILDLVGVEHGTPWVRRFDKSIWARKVDGSWTEISHAETVKGDGGATKPVELYATGPNEVVLAGEHFRMRSKNVGRRFRSLHTVHPVAEPKLCGG